MEKLSIKCPNCNKTHIYNLEVKRAFSMGMNPSLEKGKGTKDFTRLFSCPTTDKMFQVTFTINEQPNEKITEVIIKNQDK